MGTVCHSRLYGATHVIVKRSRMCCHWCVSLRACFSRLLHTRQSS